MQRAVQVQQQQTVQRQAAEDLQDMIKAGKEKYPDFEQVVGSQHVPITEVMMTTMMAIDGGHEIAYSLGMNPAEAARIARMPPSSQAREIGKLAREIAAAAAASAAPAVTTAPVAPPLPKTLTQTRSAGGQFTKTWTGPTPLDDIFRKK
jgi:predicted outer membrane protein